MHLDEERPAKRRKTLHESSEHINASAYQQLTLLLNGSSHDSPILNLSNLHNIVQYVSLTPLLTVLLTIPERNIPLYQKTQSRMKRRSNNYSQLWVKSLALARGVSTLRVPFRSIGRSSVALYAMSRLPKTAIRKSTGTGTIAVRIGKMLSPHFLRSQKNPNFKIRRSREF